MATESLYTGLSERSKLLIITLSAAVAIINLVLAWSFAYKAQSTMSIGLEDMEPHYAWIAKAGGEKLSQDVRHDIAARGMHIVALTKMTANKHAIVLSCFGMAFALVAVGFALFVLGVDGAFKLSGSAGDKTQITVTATAPGLLCFLLSAALVAVGVQQKIIFELPMMPTAVDIFTNSQADACSGYRIDGRCLTEEQYKALERGGK